MQVLDSSWLWEDRWDADVTLILYTNAAIVPHLRLSALRDESISAIFDTSNAKGPAAPSTVSGDAGCKDNSTDLCMNSPSPSIDEPLDICTEDADEEDGRGAPAAATEAAVQHDIPRQMDSASKTNDVEHFTSEHKLHALIIASASTYFRVHLKTNVGRDSTKDRDHLTRSFRYELHEQVDPYQMEAAVAVLELMYKHQLPETGVSTRTLLSMLQVRSRGCCEACKRALKLDS